MINVLIVEDSLPMRQNLAETISGIRQVAALEEAGTVKDALEKFARRKADVVTLDIELPDGKGFEVLKTIKKEHPKTVVIVLTNHAHEEYQKLSTEAGADFFLDKSAGPKVITNLVRWLALQSGTAPFEAKQAAPEENKQGLSESGSVSLL